MANYTTDRSDSMTKSNIMADGKDHNFSTRDEVPISEGVLINADSPSSGHGAVKKDMGWIGILSAGYNMSNSWLVIAATMTISLSYGPMITIWGIILTTVLYAAVGLTLAELISAYPTTGGEYHWTSILAPASINNICSYYVGFWSWFSWLMMSASSCAAVGNSVNALVYNANPEYVIKPWESFLIYEFVVVLATVVTLFGKKILSPFYSFGFILSLVSFLVIVIVTVAMQPVKQPSSVVWTSYASDSGWPVGMEFIIGLTSPVIAFCPMDGAVHLVDQVKQAPRIIPKTVMAALVISFVTSIAFTLAMMYCVTDFDAVLSTPSGFPLFEIWSQATSTNVVPVVFTILVIFLLPFGSIACAQVASMMTWSLGRDGGLPFGHILSRINARLEVPVESLLFNWAIMAIVGVLFLFSSVAFNSIVGVVVVLQQLIMAVPSIFVIYHGRSSSALSPTRSFRLPQWLGWICNIVTVLFSALTVICFQFPGVVDPSVSSMNFACVVFGGVTIFATINWFAFARKSYFGPLSVELHN